MASKYHLENSSFYQDGTDTPRNKFNIIDSIEIHELEKELIEEAYSVFYDELDENTLFDETYFKELHRRTFESLYEWAGKYRDFNMSKGESRFCQGAYVSSESQKIFDALRAENYLKNCETLSIEELASKIAYYKCELIALHPFCELNGRITRLFFDMIVLFNGYEYIDYSTTTPDLYIEASIECVQFADCQKMEKIIYDGLKKETGTE
ncbi:MAG: Fic family protein [Sulfuricurvum sp.]|nr:Fic family protein [Sulfuricurvum sp.]